MRLQQPLDGTDSLITGGTGNGDMTSPKGVQEAMTARRTAAMAAACAVGLLLCLAALLLQHTRVGSPLLRYLVRSGWPDLQPSGRGSWEAAAGGPQARPQPPPPPPYCAFNTLLPRGEVHWSKANGTADQLSVRGCSLRRMGHAEAKQCLAGKRLVFIGDSVTRYQYLTLLHFLDRGRWPAPLGGDPGEPSVANEREWPSWNDFLRGSNALFGGRELCDCYREEYDPLKGQIKPPEEEKHENRFYTTPDGIFVSHLTYTTFPNKLHGHFGFPPYPQGRQPCAPATCNSPEDWAHHLAEGLAGPVKDMRPTHLVLNSGLWGTSNKFEGWPAIAAAGRAAVAAQGGRAIWKTTTGSKGKFPTQPGHDAMAIEHTQAAGWDLLDAFNITRPLTHMKPRPMWDGRHFKALVYRELNLYLLNMIC